MHNFKVTNLSTKSVLFLNQDEKNTFQQQKRNSVLVFGSTKYNYMDITEGERIRKISIYNDILFTLAAFMLLYTSIFALLFIFSEIDKFIFSL